MIPKRIHILNKLRVQIGEWADLNFEFHRPKLGVFEECGEMMNCILKRFQGIRGMDDDKMFKEKLTDALADAGIYLLHDMALQGESLVNELDLDEIDSDDLEAENIEMHFSQLADILGQLLAKNDMEMLSGKMIHRALFDKLATIGAIYEIDLIEAIAYTWSNVVQKRNWKLNSITGETNPKTGGEDFPKGII